MGLRMVAGRLAGDTLPDALRARHAERLRRYREYLDAYEGRHWERPRGGRTTLTLNYCRAIVDKGVSYLLGRGIGFAVPDTEQGLAPEAARRAERILYTVYEDEGLEAVDLAAAQNAAILGDAALKVAWDPWAGRIRVHNVDPFGFFPRWSADDQATLWRVDLVYQLEAEEAERLYGVRGVGLVDVAESWTAERFQLTVGGNRLRDQANPYGFVPFVHVPNLPQPNEPWGVSDVRDIIGINRALNERMSEQADTIRYHADPPVIFKGVQEHTDLAVGPGTVWDIPADAEVKLLEWQGSAPAVEGHIDRLLRALHDVSETPRTSFGDSGRLLSGVALEMELRPLIQRTMRKRVIWTRALRARNSMVLRLAERFGYLGTRPGELAPYRTRIIWPPLLPRDDAQEVRNNVALVAAGLRSARTAMDALGTEDPEAELARVVEDRRALGGPEPFKAPAAP